MNWNQATRTYRLDSGLVLPEDDGMMDLEGPIGPTFDIGWMRHWSEFTQQERNEIAAFMAAEWLTWAAGH